MLLGSLLMGLTLVAFTVTSQWFLPGLLTVFVLSTVSSVLVVGLQMRLMQVAGDAQTIGAAMNHASLNIANALGAWLGGVVVAAGFGYTATGVGRCRALARRACWCCSRRRCCTAARPDGLTHHRLRSRSSISWS